MTRKEELFAYYKSVKDRAVCVTLFIKMPTGETEVISNSNIEAKMASRTMPLHAWMMRWISAVQS